MTLDSISHKMFLVPLLHYPQIMFNFKFSKTGLFLNLNFILMAKSTYSMKDLKISLYSFVDPLLLRPFLLRFRKKQWLAPWIYLTFTVWDSISNQRGELFWLQIRIPIYKDRDPVTYLLTLVNSIVFAQCLFLSAFIEVITEDNIGSKCPLHLKQK